MGLDAAFIVDSRNHPYSEVDHFTLTHLRNSRRLHASLVKGFDTFKEGPYGEITSREVSLTPSGGRKYSDHEERWTHYRVLSQKEVAERFCTVMFTLDPDVMFFSDEDLMNGSRDVLELVYKMVMFYYPGMGDRLIYAWSE